MFLDFSGRIASNSPGLYYGACVFDYDGDGELEIFVACHNGPNRLLKWLDGALVDVAPTALADAQRQAIGVAAGDFNGDGREELYVLNTDTYAGPKEFADRLFARRADGRWEDLFQKSENRSVRNLNAGRSVAVLDRRGTGRYSFLVANYGRPMRLYELGPNHKIADLASCLKLTEVTGGRALWTGPLVTTFTDILCLNEHGRNFLYANQGDGNFEECSDEFGLADEEEHGRGIAVFDANGDGKLDVACGNWEGPHRLMVRRIDNTFRNQATPAMAFPSANRNVLAADFDNDGTEELFFNNIGEPNRLFRQSADGQWTLVEIGEALEPFGLGTGACYVDIDNDGILELLVCHGEDAPQPLSLFKSAQASPHWLRVQPLTRFGAPARGAKVELQQGNRLLVRVICGGSGYLCQMEPIAHFGLGPEGVPPSKLRITWPDGCQMEMTNPPTHCLIQVPYVGG